MPNRKRSRSDACAGNHSRHTRFISAYGILAGCLTVILFVFMVSARKPAGPPCANTGSCQDGPVERIENGISGIFLGRTVPVPAIDPSREQPHPWVLGDSDPSLPKHIYVDLSEQKLFAYEGPNLIFETWVSTGRWGRTPEGNFNIWSKLRSTRMSGGSGSDYYNLPNVPFTMYFYRDFGLHGAYWHNNFGHTMSHGCVNLRQIDAEVLFNWADGPANGQPGTPVSVCTSFTGPDVCEQVHPVK